MNKTSSQSKLNECRNAALKANPSHLVYCNSRQNCGIQQCSRFQTRFNTQVFIKHVTRLTRVQLDSIANGLDFLFSPQSCASEKSLGFQTSHPFAQVIWNWQKRRSCLSWKRLWMFVSNLWTSNLWNHPINATVILATSFRIYIFIYCTYLKATNREGKHEAKAMTVNSLVTQALN